MIVSKALLGLAGLVTATSAYSLVDSYNAFNFNTTFNFIHEPDPTHGVGTYVTASEAERMELAGGREGQIYIGVDHKTPNAASRSTVRVSSNKAYNGGLFIFDVAHMPVGCGVWPAIWLFGPGWPNSGEIDIAEGVNNDLFDTVTLHTSPGCTVQSTGSMTPVAQPDCSAPGGKATDGCSEKTNVEGSFGPKFNQNKGGVYAMEWTTDHIAAWFFPRDSVPKHNFQAPNPAEWGQPMAKFTGCDFKDHFRNQNIIINIALCGDWPNGVWGTQGGCKDQTKQPTCEAFVRSSPDRFTEAFFQIGSITVFE